MKLYKFKDLTYKEKHHEFLDIVLQNRIWCANPAALNDENEFQFKLDYNPSYRSYDLLSQVVDKFGTNNYLPSNISAHLTIEKLESYVDPIFKDLITKCRNTLGVTSFSITSNDEHLWNEYGEKGNGVFIEIEVPDHLVGQSYHLVNYVSEKIFHVDTILESSLFDHKVIEAFRNILLTKTKLWVREEEIRFIGTRQNVHLILDGHINEVTFGRCVPSNTYQELMALIGTHCYDNNIRIKKI